jgi:hypothetical protein
MDVDCSGPGGYRHCRLFSLLLRRNGDCRMFTQPAPSINCGFQKHGGLTGTALLLAFKIFPHRPVVMIATLDPFLNKMKIGYARVSTLEQNLDLQLRALKKAGCRRTFQEKISAGTCNRPEFQRMLDQIRAGDTIIVWKLDRLARSTRDLLETMETIRGAGGKFQSLSEPWADTTTHAGKMIIPVLQRVEGQPPLTPTGKNPRLRIFPGDDFIRILPIFFETPIQFVQLLLSDGNFVGIGR